MGTPPVTAVVAVVVVIDVSPDCMRGAVGDGDGDDRTITPGDESETRLLPRGRRDAPATSAVADTPPAAAANDAEPTCDSGDVSMPPTSCASSIGGATMGVTATTPPTTPACGGTTPRGSSLLPSLSQPLLAAPSRAHKRSRLRSRPRSRCIAATPLPVLRSLRLPPSSVLTADADSRRPCTTPTSDGPSLSRAVNEPAGPPPATSTPPPVGMNSGTTGRG
jgi:hypothetical protein